MPIKRLMDDLEGTADPDARAKALGEEAELFRLIIAGDSDFAIFTIDRGRRILTWNPGAERPTGFPGNSIIGQSIDVLFTPEDREAGIPTVEVELAVSEGRAEDDPRHIRQDGSRSFASGLLMPLRDEAGNVRALLKIFRDQTERERAGRLAEAAGREMEARVAERTAELSRALDPSRARGRRAGRTELARSELLRRIVTVREEERARISREPHDEMGQHIAALTLELKLLRGSFEESAASIERLRGLQERTTKVGQDLHRLAFELRPPTLDDMGLEVAVQNYLEEWSERYGIASAFHGDGFRDGHAPSSIETAIYRILQEA